MQVSLGAFPQIEEPSIVPLLACRSQQFTTHARSILLVFLGVNWANHKAVASVVWVHLTGTVMQTADIVLIAAVVLCAIGFAALSIVLLRVFDALRALRREVREMREQTLPLIADLRSTTDYAKSAMDGARADLERFDRVLGSAEAISEAVETSGRAARRLFAAPVIKAVGTVTGVKRAVGRLKSPGSTVEVVSHEKRRA